MHYPLLNYFILIWIIRVCTFLILILYDIIKKEKINLIIGHSVGGVLAFYLAKETNVPALLLCPAFGDKFKQYTFTNIKNNTPKMTAIIGSKDDEVNRENQLNILKNQPNCEIKIEDIGHDVPQEMLKKEATGFKY